MRNKNTYAYDINMHQYIGGNAKNIQMIKTRKKIKTH